MSLRGGIMKERPTAADAGKLAASPRAS